MEQALSQTGIAWSDILGIAVTNRPGLVGSLIVGLVTAKTLSLSHEIPFIGVHHIRGHVMAPFVSDETYTGPTWVNEEFLALVVSGGHSHIYRVGSDTFTTLGQTIDDAAGEAFDKFAKMLGLPYPGGVHVDKLAQNGDASAYEFPKPMIKDGLNLSFSGLKAAAQRLLERLSDSEKESRQADLCASFQKTVVDILITKLEKAHKQTGLKRLVVCGGVSANSELRARAQGLADKYGLDLAIPPLRYCTDNAVMIARAGLVDLLAGRSSDHDLAPSPRSELT